MASEYPAVALTKCCLTQFRAISVHDHGPGMPRRFRRTFTPHRDSRGAIDDGRLLARRGGCWSGSRVRTGTSTQPPTANGLPAVEPASVDDDGLALPKKLGSLRFAVMGDVGRGDQAQYDTAERNGAVATAFRFFVRPDAGRQHVRRRHA